MPPSRQSTGVPALDQLLGGGLLPGTLTVLVGATGIGKSQLGVHYTHAGLAEDGRRGIFCDMSARGDSQNQIEYAERMVGWTPSLAPVGKLPEWPVFCDPQTEHGEYLRVFDYQGRRVTRRDLDWEQWQHWQSELNQRLASAIGFFYGNFIQGVRRVVIDGIEPVDTPGESIQFQLFEYVYHQVLRKDHDWVARDLFRQDFRQHADWVAGHAYEPKQIGCLLLVTSHETMLEQLIEKPLAEGDVLSNANTVIYLGKIRDGQRLGRALYIAKHRGSACDERIVPYTINDAGIQLCEV